MAFFLKVHRPQTPENIPIADESSEEDITIEESSEEDMTFDESSDEEIGVTTGESSDEEMVRGRRKSAFLVKVL